MTVHKNIAARQGAVIVSIPAIVKAHQEKSGKRVLEVEASNEAMDDEGDVIAQKALLDSADVFVKNGHIDIDHISELGHRLGISNPESYIIGRPTEVKDLGDGRTGVVAEIRRSADGSHDPIRNKYDAFWDTMVSEPPVLWRASIYGFPDESGVIDCRESKCDSGATRYHITKMQWCSLAMTRNPVNTNIKGFAKIISAKAYIQALLKSNQSTTPLAMFMSDSGLDIPPQVPPFDMGGGMPFVENSMANGGPAAASAPFPSPRNLTDAIGQYHTHLKKDCAFSQGLNTTPGFKAHFENCCGMHPDIAELFAHALMHHVLLDRRRV
jgi:hypothetical protein